MQQERIIYSRNDTHCKPTIINQTSHPNYAYLGELSGAQPPLTQSVWCWYTKTKLQALFKIVFTSLVSNNQIHILILTSGIYWKLLIHSSLVSTRISLYSMYFSSIAFLVSLVHRQPALQFLRITFIQKWCLQGSQTRANSAYDISISNVTEHRIGFKKQWTSSCFLPPTSKTGKRKNQIDSQENEHRNCMHTIDDWHEGICLCASAQKHRQLAMPSSNERTFVLFNWLKNRHHITLITYGIFDYVCTTSSFDGANKRTKKLYIYT